ncbi:dihydrofolate reductase [Aestuariivirga sp.]|uniref:dihydrofolate reductase n=1 Tax=Aestuariivirga sp. TaxID=2650926 RepID=UPI0039E2AF7F
MSRLTFVVAVSRNGVIGRDGGLPWHISSDLKRFRELTIGRPIIMGRKTWESLPKRPLPGRTNIVITRQKDYAAPGAHVVATADDALAVARRENPAEIAVIGGGEVYRMFMDRVDRIYLTEVDAQVDGDTRFPALDPGEWREVAFEVHPKGPRDSAGFTLRTLDRQKP